VRNCDRTGPNVCRRSPVISRETSSCLHDPFVYYMANAAANSSNLNGRTAWRTHGSALTAHQWRSSGILSRMSSVICCGDHGSISSSFRIKAGVEAKRGVLRCSNLGGFFVTYRIQQLYSSLSYYPRMLFPGFCPTHECSQIL
jgi:hypothetical protein